MFYNIAIILSQVFVIFLYDLPSMAWIVLKPNTFNQAPTPNRIYFLINI